MKDRVSMIHMRLKLYLYLPYLQDLVLYLSSNCLGYGLPGPGL
jgi:hypothetical protein